MFKKPEFPLMYNMNNRCMKIILNILWEIFIFMRYSHLQKNMNLCTEEHENISSIRKPIKQLFTKILNKKQKLQLSGLELMKTLI